MNRWIINCCIESLVYPIVSIKLRYSLIYAFRHFHQTTLLTVLIYNIVPLSSLPLPSPLPYLSLPSLVFPFISFPLPLFSSVIFSSSPFPFFSLPFPYLSIFSFPLPSLFPRFFPSILSVCHPSSQFIFPFLVILPPYSSFLSLIFPLFLTSSLPLWALSDFHPYPSFLFILRPF